MKQTPLQRLIEELKTELTLIRKLCGRGSRDFYLKKRDIERAKSLLPYERECIEEAASNHCYPTKGIAKQDAINYYNQTFESDESKSEKD